jgi:hypothetical protein
MSGASRFTWMAASTLARMPLTVISWSSSEDEAAASAAMPADGVSTASDPTHATRASADCKICEARLPAPGAECRIRAIKDRLLSVAI